MAPERPRVDLYTTIHKGIRALLFELAAACGRLDHERTEAIDALVHEVERVLGFLDEHAEHEDRHVMTVLRGLAPEVETALAAEHRALDERHREVGAAAYALGIAAPTERARAGAALARAVNQLVAAHLEHMHREETEANAALWRALDDLQLMAIRARLVGSIPPARHDEWMAFVIPALDPIERRLMAAGATPAPAR